MIIQQSSRVLWVATSFSVNACTDGEVIFSNDLIQAGLAEFGGYCQVKEMTEKDQDAQYIGFRVQTVKFVD